jgi:HAD superfamily hydrolase (TIGR01459 family)
MADSPLIDGLAPLSGRFDAILCDVWGVVHNGREHFAGACAALQRFRAETGGVVILITNAPRPFPPILEQLARLGVPRDAFDSLVTSGDVTLAFIAARGDAPLYHIGPERDLAFFEILRERTGVKPPLVPLEEADYVVCTGLFDDDETPADYESRFALMRARGLEFISANPDLTVHVGDRELYCAGALAQRYAELGGRVLQAGKPFAPIYERALALAGEKAGRPIRKSRVLAIGDGLRTDIRGAVDQGLPALFISHGVHRAELHPGGATRAPDGGVTRAPFDAAAYARAIAAAGVTPLAVMPELVW